MPLHLVTGYAGEAHVTAPDMGSLYAGICGEGDLVLPRGSQLNPEIMTNNRVRINDGDMLIQGRHVRLAVDTYEEVDIENGTQSMKRHDLIVVQYEKNATTGVETCSFAVVKGTADETAPVDPETTPGSILDGDTLHQFPLYRVVLDGLTLTDVVPLFAVYTTQTTADGAGAHNATYRGKSLGNAVTDEQYAVIADGTFADLFIGDYWEIDDVVYRIAGFDYYYQKGDTATSAHHVTIVPDVRMGQGEMNTTATTTGGYASTVMRTTNLTPIKTTIASAFGSHVLQHRQRLCNASTGGRPSGCAWFDCQVELLSEVMVYGTVMFTPMNTGTSVPALQSLAVTQLPLFAMRPDLITCARSSYWLRDVVSAGSFAAIDNTGSCTHINANNAFGIRPVFSIKGV